MAAERGFIVRGQYGWNVGASALFFGLRALDPLLQRYFLQKTPWFSLFDRLGLARPSPGPSGGSLITTASLGLTPFQTIVWGLSITSAAKQIYWDLFTHLEPMDSNTAIIVSLVNTICNTANTFAFTLAGSNPTWSPSLLYGGLGLNVTGILIEAISETQRTQFKVNPENKGKPYAGGLFSLARNINYGGYTMWRGAYALATGGPIWGAIVGGFFALDFVKRGIPVLEKYCKERYGEQWSEVERKVPARLFPGIY